jgi:flagellar biosynthetic protein FliO
MDLAGQAIRMIGAMGIVLATLFLIVYGLKRTGYLGKLTRDSALIEIVAKRSLNPKAQLMIVKVKDSYFLLGTSPQGIHHLSRLDNMDLDSSPLVKADFK